MTISEVSEKFGLTPDTLRYYERIGLIPPVPRTRSGLRDYDESSCNWIEFIKCMSMLLCISRATALSRQEKICL